MSLPTKIKLSVTIVGLETLVIVPDSLYWVISLNVVAMFEALELVLDEIIHHPFPTSCHTNQIIVVYLMTRIFLYAGYKVLRDLQQLTHSVRVAHFGWKGQYWENFKIAGAINRSGIFGCFLDHFMLNILFLTRHRGGATET